AVVLATPHSLHAGQIIAAAKARKHVFVEKPFALALGDARAAVRACAKNKLTLAIGYNWRFQPALMEIKSMLVDGRLGKLLHIEGNFCGPSVYRFGREHWRQSREEGPAGRRSRLSPKPAPSAPSSSISRKPRWHDARSPSRAATNCTASRCSKRSSSRRGTEPGRRREN